MSFRVRHLIPIIAAAVLPMIGCGPTAEKVADTKTEDKPSLVHDDREPFRAEDARNALIEMVGKSHKNALIYGLPYLRTDEIVREGPSRVTIGKWEVDLEKKTFVITLANPDKNMLYQASGVFEQGPDGTWKAKITHEVMT